MIFKGFKIRVKCADWEQTKILGKYWNLFTSFVDSKK